MLSDDFTINGREYNFDYREQHKAKRTIIVVSSQSWDRQDDETITRLRELLALRVSVNSNPNLPRMLFVQKKQADGKSTSVPIEELKMIVKNSLDEL